MSDKSNNQGRAYEFVCLLTLGEEIGKIRPVNIVQNSSYLAAEYAWNTLSPEMKNIYKVSSYAAVIQIFELEPRIMEKGGDVLELRIQSDTKGKEGDVRDILIVRHNIQWEIGLSLKHNHFAVKHSRLSQKLANEQHTLPAEARNEELLFHYCAPPSTVGCAVISLYTPSG